MGHTQHQLATIAIDRPLTEKERSLAHWMLVHGSPEAPPFIAQLDQVRVVGQCPCGCASIDFAVGGLPAPTGDVKLLGDFLFGDDAHLCGVFIFARNGVLAGVEVTGYAVDPPSILPSPLVLRELR